MGESDLEVCLLKSWDFSEWRARYGHGYQLPYRMDHLAACGVTLQWSDAVHRIHGQARTGGKILHWAETHSVPFAQTMLLGTQILRSPVTFAMFESEANFLAGLRSALPGKRSTALAVMTCWLTQILQAAGPRRLRAYRHLYRKVDRLYCLSSNQVSLLTEMLEIPASRVRHVSFGIDDEEFSPPGEDEGDGGYVLVVGRDRGRDWNTIFRALSGTTLPVKVCARPSDLAGLEVPKEVEMLGYVDRLEYASLLRRARVVVVGSRPVVYPSGQSVLLEAMAMGRSVVVSGTEALSEYIEDGSTCLAVPPGDPDALRDGVVSAYSDAGLRDRLGREARRSVEEQFSARVMWRRIARDLYELAERPVPASLTETSQDETLKQGSDGCN